VRAAFLLTYLTHTGVCNHCRNFPWKGSPRHGIMKVCQSSSVELPMTRKMKLMSIIVSRSDYVKGTPVLIDTIRASLNLLSPPWLIFSF
jgi:hypothetical protein